MNKRGIMITISRESTQIDYPYEICPGREMLNVLSLMKDKGISTYFNHNDPLLDKWIHWADDENYSGDLSEIEGLYPLYFVMFAKDEMERYMSDNNIIQTIKYVDDTFDLSDFTKMP